MFLVLEGKLDQFRITIHLKTVLAVSVSYKLTTGKCRLEFRIMLHLVILKMSSFLLLCLKGLDNC